MQLEQGLVYNINEQNFRFAFSIENSQDGKKSSWRIKNMSNGSSDCMVKLKEKNTRKSCLIISVPTKIMQIFIRLITNHLKG